MAKAVGLFLVLAAVAAVAVGIAALLVAPGAVGAQGMPEVGCPRSEIVPGSIAVTSTNREVGRVSGHTIRFRLCPTGESPAAAGGTDRPVKIGLRWRKGWFLSNPAEAGIQLRRGDYSWHSDAAEELPAGPGSWIYSGVVFPFPPDDLIETDAGAAADWYFDIPSTAGMLNPRLPGGESGLQLVFYYGPSGYCKEYAHKVPLTLLPRPNTEGILRLSEDVGRPGGTIVVQGSGFPPLAPMQSIWASFVDLSQYHDLATDDRGNLEFEFQVPGLNPGKHHLTVEVNGGIVGVSFFVPQAWDGIYYTPVAEVAERLDGNFVRSFHYRCDTKTWIFYDPEVGHNSNYNAHYTQHHFIPGSRYWLLVKEPMEVILNRQVRNLTCRADGNCWNFIVW